MIKKAFDFFLFTSLFIACCAVLMVWQTGVLFGLAIPKSFYLFSFSGTLCSYNFHWYLTPNAFGGSKKALWSVQHKQIHLLFILLGVIGACWALVDLLAYWPYLLATAFITFLYSAPKIPHPTFSLLQKIAIGKTLFLAFVWAHVTTLLPLLLFGKEGVWAVFLFVFNRFTLIYAICILFDYRDREQDKKEGIKSLITYLNDQGIERLFWLTLLLFLLTAILLHVLSFSLLISFFLLIPGVIVALIHQYAKRNFSDYLYYFILDGLMMFSALLLLIFQFNKFVE